MKSVQLQFFQELPCGRVKQIPPFYESLYIHAYDMRTPEDIVHPTNLPAAATPQADRPLFILYNTVFDS